jgi:hypothetical protein
MRKRLSKEDLKRLAKGDAIVKKRTAIEAKIKEWDYKLTQLQDLCPHYHSWYENKGSTGSWDRDDHFWRDYECEDCGKRWTTDQSYEQEEKYPYAVKGKRNSDGDWEEYKW